MSASPQQLRTTLRRIDGRGYKAYKGIQGSYSFERYTVHIDQIQRDPFAPASRVRVRVPQNIAGFSKAAYSNRSREVALRDFLTRRFHEAATRYAKGRRGSGNSGNIGIDRPRQEILERSSALVTDSYVEVRFVMGLPAFGRSVAASHAEEMFLDELPRIVYASLLFENTNRKALERHIAVAEDADYLRGQLDVLDLVSFVADGSVLPRASGVSQRPLAKEKVVPFQSPHSMRIGIDLPHRGRVYGMGIRKGITLIVGGGYHGKSTLLRALELGVYNHVPGDGREFVVTNQNAMKIRAEDGRRIEKVDISPFIANLPFGQTTKAFSTEDASGSTSQAANIIEALEAGAIIVLIDEDTSATNFMIRDHRMQELVAKEKEPITPFIDKVRQLHRDLGVSTILVMGGSGDYFDQADCTICMLDYRPYDVTAESKAIAQRYQSERKAEGGEHFGTLTERKPVSRSFDPARGTKQVKISPKGLQSIGFGAHTIDLGAVEQLVDPSQTRAIGDAIHYATTRHMDDAKTMHQVITAVTLEIERNGLDILSSRPTGDYAMFRPLEFAAAINRLRTLSVHGSEPRLTS